MTHFIGIGQDVGIAVSQELTRKQFAAYATLDTPDAADLLREGEWGFVKLANAREMSLGGWALDKAAIYPRTQWEMMREA